MAISDALIAGGAQVVSSLAGGLLGQGSENRRRKEREFVRRQIMQLIEELRNRPNQGILTGGEQEQAIRQQRQALQPTLQSIAGKLSRGIGLSQPGAQLALGRTLVGQEAGQRFQLSQQNQERRFSSEQRLRDLLARLTTSLPR